MSNLHFVLKLNFMTKSKKYEDLTKELVKAIDVAIESLELYPMPGYGENDMKNIIDFYLKEKEMALNPKPKFRNITSLNYQIHDVLTLFREGNGDHVEYFWKKIEENRIKFTRDHLIFKILKRKKIRNDLEFGYVNEVMFNFFEREIISELEYDLLGKMIKEYELK